MTVNHKLTIFWKRFSNSLRMWASRASQVFTLLYCRITKIYFSEIHSRSAFTAFTPRSKWAFGLIERFRRCSNTSSVDFRSINPEKRVTKWKLEANEFHVRWLMCQLFFSRCPKKCVRAVAEAPKRKELLAALNQTAATRVKWNLKFFVFCFYCRENKKKHRAYDTSERNLFWSSRRTMLQLAFKRETFRLCFVRNLHGEIW